MRYIQHFSLSWLVGMITEHLWILVAGGQETSERTLSERICPCNVPDPSSINFQLLTLLAISISVRLDLMSGLVIDSSRKMLYGMVETAIQRAPAVNTSVLCQ